MHLTNGAKLRTFFIALISFTFLVTFVALAARANRSEALRTEAFRTALSAPVPAPPAIADLSVTKVDSPDPVNTGSTLTYTITVTNNGPDPASSASLSDTLPAG